MTETVIGFIIWCVTGCFLIALGIYSLFSEKAVGFWANSEMFQVTNVRKYNNAMCKLLCALGIVFIILGIPLLEIQNSVWILFSVVGVMFEVIVAMVIYITVIEKKYKKK